MGRTVPFSAASHLCVLVHGIPHLLVQVLAARGTPLPSRQQSPHFVAHGGVLVVHVQVHLVAHGLQPQEQLLHVRWDAGVLQEEPQVGLHVEVDVSLRMKGIGLTKIELGLVHTKEHESALFGDVTESHGDSGTVAHESAHFGVLFGGLAHDVSDSESHEDLGTAAHESTHFGVLTLEQGLVHDVSEAESHEDLNTVVHESGVLTVVHGVAHDATEAELSVEDLGIAVHKSTHLGVLTVVHGVAHDATESELHGDLGTAVHESMHFGALISAHMVARDVTEAELHEDLGIVAHESKHLGVLTVVRGVANNVTEAELCEDLGTVAHESRHLGESIAAHEVAHDVVDAESHEDLGTVAHSNLLSVAHGVAQKVTETALKGGLVAAEHEFAHVGELALVHGVVHDIMEAELQGIFGTAAHFGLHVGALGAGMQPARPEGLNMAAHTKSHLEAPGFAHEDVHGLGGRVAQIVTGATLPEFFGTVAHLSMHLNRHVSGLGGGIGTKPAPLGGLQELAPTPSH